MKIIRIVFVAAAEEFWVFFDPRVLEIFSVCKQKIDDSYNFRIESTNLIYYGLCKTCEQQEKHKINSKGGESM